MTVTQTNKLTFDIKTASAFLNYFHYHGTTLQLVIPEGKDLPAIPGKILWNKSKGSSAVFFKGALSDPDQKQVLQDLFVLQHQNLGVFFMVNEGDGVIYPPHKTCRSADSVILLKSCFIDTDSGDIKNAQHFCKSFDIQPHIIVKSSTNKYHLYFLIEETAKSSSTLFKWESIQQSFMAIDPRFDQSMSDCSKLLRVPGFYHTKKQPQLIEIIKYSNHERYSLDELFDRIDAHKTPPKRGEKFVRPAEGSVVGESSRHGTLNSYLSSVSNKTLSHEELTDLATGFAASSFEDGLQWLPNGTRHTELLSQVQTFINYREEEEKKISIEVAESLLPPNINGNGSHSSTPEILTPIHDPFALPVDFYFDCPGITGSIVKEISRTALYPVPAFAFAVTLAAIGTLKSRSIETSLGHSPCNYFMCFGPSGVGKNYAQEVWSATFQQLGLGRLLNGQIRSERGIIRFLEENSSVGFLLMDEAETFFAMLNAKNSDSYIRQCKDALLTIYTSTRKNSTFGYVGNKKEKPVSLDKPKLNLVSHGVIHTIEKSFSMKAIMDGFLQRFIVITAFEDRIRNENFVPSQSLAGSLFDAIKQLTIDSGLFVEGNLNLISDLTASIEEAVRSNEAQENGVTESEIASLEAQLVEATRVPDAKKMLVKFNPEALREYQKFQDSMDKLSNREARKGNGMEGLYTRGGEQVGRLAAVIANPLEGITVELLEYLISFIEARVEGLKAYCEEKLVDPYESKGPPIDKDYDRLKSFMAERISVSQSGTVTWREIIRRFPKRSSKYLGELLERGIELEEIREIKNSRSGEKKGRTGTHYRLNII